MPREMGKRLSSMLLMALTAPPFLLAVAGCSFTPRQSGYIHFKPGPSPQTWAIFCNIEIARQCAGPDDVANGIDLTKQDEQGFWANRSGDALDYSPDALALCGGRPIVIRHRGAFPAGSAACLNAPSRIGLGVDASGDERYGDVRQACADWCLELGVENCDDSRVRAAHRAAQPIANACTPGGLLRDDFFDVRLLPPAQPIAWVDGVGVFIGGNSIEKATESQEWDAGAASDRLLPIDRSGLVEFTAAETDRERALGLTPGVRPDTDPSDADLGYAVVLERDGVLHVLELGQVIHTDTYAAGDRLGIAVLGNQLNYFKNGARIAMGATIARTMPMRVTASLKERQDGRPATIADARSTF